MQLNIQKRTDKDICIFDLQGKIMIDKGAVELREAVHQTIEAGSSKILLNLNGVTSIDSSGIGELVSSCTTVADSGGTLKLVNLPKKIQDLLMISGLLSVFQTFDNENEAIESFY